MLKNEKKLVNSFKALSADTQVLSSFFPQPRKF